MRYYCTLVVMVLTGVIACNVLLALQYHYEGYGLHPMLAALSSALIAFCAYKIHNFGEQFK